MNKIIVALIFSSIMITACSEKKKEEVTPPSPPVVEPGDPADTNPRGGDAPYPPAVDAPASEVNPEVVPMPPQETVESAPAEQKVAQ